MWGTLDRHALPNRNPRFIPTHVGNTAGCLRSPAFSAVHPHACGEHNRPAKGSLMVPGSSPRMWGTLREVLLQRHHARFIPTHVGNTTSSRRPPIWRPVHPHACGEHPNPLELLPSSSGSSPRMWGTHRTRAVQLATQRFIPTHVGNTRDWPAAARHPAVHPHACGEHSTLIANAQATAGSSPRMWGTHLPYSIVFKEEKTPRKIYRLILYSVVRSRGWNATNCSPSNNTGCRRLTPRVWNS